MVTYVGQRGRVSEQPATDRSSQVTAQVILACSSAREVPCPLKAEKTFPATCCSLPSETKTFLSTHGVVQVSGVGSLHLACAMSSCDDHVHGEERQGAEMTKVKYLPWDVPNPIRIWTHS